MPTIEQLGSRLASLHELQSVVRTMKALSAASIRQYEQAARALADYYRTVELGLHVVLRDREQPPQVLPHDERPLAAIVFGSDHGLCGRFNEDLADFVMERLQEASAPHQERVVLAVGARIATRLEQAGQTVAADFLVPGSAARITASVQQILLKIDEWRTEKGTDHVYVFYNRHVSSARYRPTGVELLPVNLRRFHRLEAKPWPSRVLPTYSMDREHLFSTLLRQYFFVTLFRACAESQASEHGSRLAAMRAAEKNLQERVDEVGLKFRQARQGLITSELLDVVAGFEALTGGESH
jgi:F-type H+-transporting ATPase subunit gamma